MSHYTPQHVFDLSNAKAVKSLKKGYLNAVMYMQPWKRTPGTPNVCPFAGSCIDSCLHYAGNSAHMLTKTKGRQNKNRWYAENKASFLKAIAKDIEYLQRMCVKWAKEPNKEMRKALSRAGLPETRRTPFKLAVRLNGTSDLPWEKSGIMRQFPRIQFYDYTKNPVRALQFARGQMPSNYHLTFSMGGTRDDQIPEILASGCNVTMVFARGKSGTLPPSFSGTIKRGYVPKHGTRELPKVDIVIPSTRVVDADETDLRFLDPRGVIAGLRFKSPKMMNMTAESLALIKAMEGDQIFPTEERIRAAEKDFVIPARSNPSGVQVGHFGCGGYNIVVEI